MPHFDAPPPLSLYVHLPWCVRKCPYCDFNSHATRGKPPFEAYVDALLRDAGREAGAAAGRVVETVFLGGGTPSLFPPEAIARLLAGLRERLALAGDAEITLEANPGTLEQGRFGAFRQAGVTRLSIGVQSFDAGQLRRLGRIHGPDEARAAAAAALDASFESFNLDLMFALPAQTPAQAVADVEAALALEPPHLSLYQLTLEPGTAFHARPPALPDDDDAFEIQRACHRRLRAAGFRQYEISAWAKPGHECRHNLNYWTFGDYLAIGAGAHGKLTDVRTGAIHRYAGQRLPRRYIETAGTEDAVVERRSLGEADAVLECMMNVLRLTAGVPAALCTDRTGLPWSAFEPGVAAAVARGWLRLEQGRLAPTARGSLFLNDLLAGFLPEAA